MFNVECNMVPGFTNTFFHNSAHSRYGMFGLYLDAPRKIWNLFVLFICRNYFRIPLESGSVLQEVVWKIKWLQVYHVEETYTFGCIRHSYNLEKVPLQTKLNSHCSYLTCVDPDTFWEPPITPPDLVGSVWLHFIEHQKNEHFINEFKLSIYHPHINNRKLSLFKW